MATLTKRSSFIAKKMAFLKPKVRDDSLFRSVEAGTEGVKYAHVTLLKLTRLS